MICFSLWASATVFQRKEMLNQLTHSIHQYSICFVLLSWLKSFNLQLHVRKTCYIHRHARVQNRCCLLPSWQNRCRRIRCQLQFYDQIFITLRGSKNQDSIFFYFCVKFVFVFDFFIFPSLVLVTSSPFSIPRSQFFVSVTSQ